MRIIKYNKGIVPAALPAGKPGKLCENSIAHKLRIGKKVIAVELDSPAGDVDTDEYMSGVSVLKRAGADAITIADCPMAQARIDSSLMACKIKREMGITSIPHMTCRDRNLNATKALLFGLQAEGVDNVLVVTGDPVPVENRGEIKTLFSYDSTALAGHISELNKTVFSRPFHIYSALNINAVNFDSELRRAKKKIQNGVTVFMTQPVLSKAAAVNLKRAHDILPAKILGGIMPIVSYRNACYLDSKVSGIRVSREIIEQYRDLNKEQAYELAVNLSAETALAIEEWCDGYYIITPFNRIDIVEKVILRILSLIEQPAELTRQYMKL